MTVSNIRYELWDDLNQKSIISDSFSYMQEARSTLLALHMALVKRNLVIVALVEERSMADGSSVYITRNIDEQGVMVMDNVASSIPIDTTVSSI